MKRFQQLAKKLFESSISVHLLFIICFLVLFNLPGILNDLPENKLLKVIVYGLFILLCIYSGRWCCKTFLAKNRFHRFFLYSPMIALILFLTGLSGLRLITSNRVENIIFVTVAVVGMSFSTGIFLSVTRSALLKQISESNIREEQMRSELKLLQNQLSPHFLFNTLNNLYGISLSRHGQLPALLLKLSDLLRYSLYDVNGQFVPLGQEIEYINNYIEFETLRISDRLILKKKIDTFDESVLVAPMLFIVFIENAFKHARETLNKKIDICISIKEQKDSIAFSVANSYNSPIKQDQMPVAYSGLGITNTIKRLDILYGKNYVLKHMIADEKYIVDLVLKTKA